MTLQEALILLYSGFEDVGEREVWERALNIIKNEAKIIYKKELNGKVVNSYYKNELIGREFKLDLGSSSPIDVKVESFSGVYVILRYLGSSVNRTEKFFIDEFEKLTGIEIKSCDHPTSGETKKDGNYYCDICGDIKPF